ncbi:MAG: hypothetical protein SCH71_16650 [Desulfobulbaceae bacterium]|nr:hypothetical protein [Desulfobulbaceae bacterium]
MSPLLSSIISMIFLAAGGTALFLMLKLQGGGEPKNYRLLSKWHRLSGWLFSAIFLIMFVFMLARVENYWEESSPRIAIHVALAVALLFLLLLKSAVPRYFKKLNKHLFLLGTATYLTAFTMVWITAGYYFIRQYEEAPYISHLDLPEHMLDQELGKQLFINKCSICHLLENIMRKRSAGSWDNVVNRMIELAAPRISPGEGVQILHYLTETHVPTPPASDKAATPLAKYCLPCHAPKDIRNRTYTRTGWKDVIEEMRSYAPDLIPVDKTDEIVDYLLDLQPQQPAAGKG